MSLLAATIGLVVLGVFGGAAIVILWLDAWFEEYAGPSQAAPGSHPYEANIRAQGRPVLGASPTPAPDPTDALFDPAAIARNQRIDWPETVEPFWLPESFDSKQVH